MRRDMETVGVTGSKVTPSSSVPISPPLSHALALLCPLLMAHLAQRPNNRFVRLAVYPVGITAAVLAVLDLGARKAEQKDAFGKCCLACRWETGAD